MKRTKLAGRYAKALFDLANELEKLEEISADVCLVDRIFNENMEMRFAIHSPVIRTEKKILILDNVFKGKINEITQNYLKLILKKGREVQIDTILSEYVKLYKAYKNIVTLDVYSAQALDEHARENIKKKVAGKTKAEIELVEHIKPELIGGIILKYGDYYVDASLQNSLNKLKKQLVDTSYQSNF